jgi:hypothetical protein
MLMLTLKRRRNTLPAAATASEEYTRRGRVVLGVRSSHILTATVGLTISWLDSRLRLRLPSYFAPVPRRVGDILFDAGHTRPIDDKRTERIRRQ